MAKTKAEKLIKADEKHRNRVGSTTRRKRRKRTKSQREKTWDCMSRFIRLRDAVEYCERMNIDLGQFVRVEDLPVKCCTCDRVGAWIYGDAGHFIPRGSGGLSGVYFDERNVNFQCNSCNAFEQGKSLEYGAFMRDKYGQDVIDQLRWLDKNQSYKGKLIGLELYYRQKYEELVKSIIGNWE